MADTDTKNTTQDDQIQQKEAEEATDAPQEEVVVEEAPAEAVETKEEQATPVSSSDSKIPPFRVGDTIRVFYKIIEGDKMRIQPFEGIVISFRGSDVSKTFTVRRIGADQVGVERIFPLASPNIEKILVVKRGDVRRAKLYYLRNKKGREAMRVKEKKN